MTLKTELLNLEQSIQTSNMDDLIGKMLDLIGSTDAELRDHLIYNTFGKLIMENHLTVQQMEHILEVCYNNLFFDIGKIDSDSVFKRSFSALVLALIIEKDIEKRFLIENITSKIIVGSIEYLNLEKDIRGYVKDKGWAHSIAHGADLLTVSIQHPCFNPQLVSRCLETIKQCLFKESVIDSPYIDEEEERLIFSLEALMDKGLTDYEIEIWLMAISDELKELMIKEDYSLNFFWKKSNVVHFMRGLYFRLMYKNRSAKLREQIGSILEQWHGEMYGV